MPFVNMEQKILQNLNALVYKLAPMSHIYLVCIPLQLKKKNGLFYFLKEVPIQILAPSAHKYTESTQAQLSRIF